MLHTDFALHAAESASVLSGHCELAFFLLTLATCLTSGPRARIPVST